MKKEKICLDILVNTYNYKTQKRKDPTMKRITHGVMYLTVRKYVMLLRDNDYLIMDKRKNVYYIKLTEKSIDLLNDMRCLESERRKVMGLSSLFVKTANVNMMVCQHSENIVPIADI